MNKKSSHKLLSIMLALLMVIGMFPVTARADSTEIIIGNPGDWVTYVTAGVIELNEGDTLTIEAAAGSPTSEVKIKVNGSCTIKGHSGYIENLHIEEKTGTTMSVTLNNLHISTQEADYAYRQYGGTIHLIEKNELIGGKQNAISGGGSAITIDSDISGTLIAKSTQSAINAGSLIVNGDAQVTLKSSSSTGSFAISYQIASDAELIIEGGSRGISTGNDVNIQNDGTLTVIGNNSYGLYAKNLLYSGTGTMMVEGTGASSGISLTDAAGAKLTVNSGTIKASGGASGKALGLAGTSPKIMIDSGTLEMQNKAATTETHTFVMSGAGDPWSISGTGVTHTGSLTDESINITVPSGITGTVTRAPAALDSVCEIAGKGYPTLDSALTAVPTGVPTTITLLKSIIHTSPVVIDSKNVTFALGNFDLTIDTSAINDSTALLVTGGGVVNYTGTGSFSVIGHTTAVHATGAGSALTAGYAEATRDSDSKAFCAKATNSGTVTVKGEVLTRGTAFGLWAESGGDIVMEGDVTCLDGNSTALYCTGNSRIEMTGDITATATGKSTSPSAGVEVRAGSSAEVTGNVSASGMCVRAHETGATATVTGNIFAEGTNATGASGSNGGTATINGNISATGEAGGTGVIANSGTVVINGNVNSAYSGALATGTNGIVTINGTLTANAPTFAFYIQVGVDKKKVDEDSKPSDLPGYLQYTDGTNNVYVKIASDNVCRIDTKEYATLDEALGEAVTGDTITLLKSFSHDGLVIDNKKVIIDTNGHTLTLGKPGDSTIGLEVKGGGSFDISGTGSVNVFSYAAAVKAEGSGSKAVVSNSTSTMGVAAYAWNGSKITILQDATGYGTGVGAGQSGDTAAGWVEVHGNVIATDRANRGAVEVAHGGVVTVHRNVTAHKDGSIGISAKGALSTEPKAPSKVEVKGNVEAEEGGVSAETGSEIHVRGSVIAGEFGISTSGGSNPKVIVDGDVTATGKGVSALGEVEAVTAGGYANVTIGGNVTANRTEDTQIVTAVYANGSTIIVNKNVTTQGSGVNAQNGGKVTIEGTLNFNPTGTVPNRISSWATRSLSRVQTTLTPPTPDPDIRNIKTVRISFG